MQLIELSSINLDTILMAGYKDTQVSKYERIGLRKRENKGYATKKDKR
jgi:hypothetical protein